MNISTLEWKRGTINVKWDSDKLRAFKRKSWGSVLVLPSFKQGQQWEEISPWSRKERGVQEPSAPERLSKVTKRPGQREEREEKKPAKDRNQQSEFPLCLHKLAPVWLAAGECACVVGCGGAVPWEIQGSLFYIWTRPDDRKCLQFYANAEELVLLMHWK